MSPTRAQIIDAQRENCTDEEFDALLNGGPRAHHIIGGFCESEAEAREFTRQLQTTVRRAITNAPTTCTAGRRATTRQRGTGNRPAVRRAARSTSSSSDDPDEPGPHLELPGRQVAAPANRRRVTFCASSTLPAGVAAPAGISVTPRRSLGGVTPRGAENPRGRT